MDDPVLQLPKSIIVIREVYDKEDSPTLFARQLEEALNDSVDIIIVEPLKLGDAMSRWIALGNLIHRASIYGGFTSLFISYLWPHKFYLFTFFAICSWTFTGIYEFSWRYDPSSNYQVVKEADLAELGPPFPDIVLNSFPRPLVIAKYSDHSHRILQLASSFIASICVLRGYNYIR